MSPTKPPILQIEDVRLTFRTREGAIRALNGASLTIHEGEAVGLVGESGSGKSTLARAVLGLNPERSSRIEAGRILMAGRDVTWLSQGEWEGERGHPVAMVFQDPLSFLNPIMRIGRQIAESIERHAPQRRVAERVGELLELVKLPSSLARAYPHELSGGMRQRALLAVALACEPRLLVADEPTTALDVTTQAEILALLRDLRERLGMAMLLITHDLGIVASACERLYVIYAGRVLEWGRTQNVFAAPAHPYTVGLFHAARADRDAKGRFATIGGEPPDLGEPAQGCPFAPRCPKAMTECVRSMPDATVLDQGESHAVRCWLYPQPGDAASASGRVVGG
ncbi:MAG: ABC transporter ATP-binding protein [Hyphomicrobiales bacterium]|nr:ABC transporter ATP-binding protein [Hyphomicrobiales bacterium]